MTIKYQILQGDNRLTLKNLPDNSVDAIITDPPYGIDFLGKSWDANTGALETYQECLRVLKPGGHILAFSAARTYHHLAVTLEQAGFEIRDQIMWIYSSGFPKSQDIGKSIQRSMGVKETKAIPKDKQTKTAGFANNGAQEKDAWSGQTTVCTDPEAQAWSGWGTQLKPAHEPIALARKPIKLSIARNCQTHGVGALNIDAARIQVEGDDTRSGGSDGWDRVEFSEAEPNKYNGDGYVPNEQGRFPSNVIGDIPDYQKYFYCPKVSRRERHIGFEQLPDAEPLNSPDQVRNHPLWDPSIGTNAHRLKEKIRKSHDPLGHLNLPDFSRKKDEDGNPVKDNSSWMYDPNGVDKIQDATTTANTNVGNNHPTVKPIELMKYLIRLITPPGGVVLDPFNGSGSTGCAAVELGMTYIGCELDPKYVEIALKRIAAWNSDTTTFTELFE
jgi:site-specific DNA-methyltransferase (adenine-specific)